MDGLNECNCDAHKKVGVNYYITRWYRKSVSWRSDELETICGRENSTQRREPPGLRLSSPGERERHTAMSRGAGEVNMLQSLFSLQLSLTHNPFNKVRGIFSKRLCRTSLSLRLLLYYVYAGICIWVCGIPMYVCFYFTD